MELPARILCVAPFVAERADGGVALRCTPPISRTVLVALSVEVVLTTSGHLLILTSLIVSSILCHLSVPAFCNVMCWSLAKGTKFIVSIG